MKRYTRSLYALLLCASLHAASLYSFDAFDKNSDAQLNSDITKRYFAEDVRIEDIFDSDTLEEDLFIDGFFDTLSLDAVANRTIAIKNILGLLQSAGAFSILETDFYKRTNPFVKRSLLDLPIFEVHMCNEPRTWIVGAQLFWNQMDRSVFINHSTTIKSYLDLKQEFLFEKLNELTPQIKNLFPNASIIDEVLNETDIKKLVSLFENFTVQQRRIGAMFHAWRQWDFGEMRMLWPFYYLERNVFAKPAEQAAIEAQFGAPEPDSSEKFQKNHAISDRVGFGDFRFEFDYAVYMSDTFAFRAGAFLTLPIAFELSHGLLGTTFNKNLKQPIFDLQSLFDLIPDDFDVDSITQAELDQAHNIVIGDICKNKNGLALGALDRMNAILLDSDLGNGRHMGIGILFRARTLLSNFLDDLSWSDRVSFNNRLSIEYQTPATETRFFARRNTPQDFSSRDFDSDDPDVQQENLEFIQKEIVDKLYPYAIKTKVHPGFQIHWTSRWCFCGDVWDLTMGSDFWLQTGEKFKSIKCIDQDLRSRLDFSVGKNSFAYQFKSFAGFGIKILRPTYSVQISINAEGTSWNKNIGDDITAGFNIEANF